MEITINLPDYNFEDGIKCRWENGFYIRTEIQDNSLTIAANKEGLISLANHFLNLAQNEACLGTHLHLDSSNSLEDGSNELIIQKV